MERRDDGNYKSPGLCGGTLVASKYVISAAHCMFNYKTDVEAISNKDPQDLVIIIGDHILFDDIDATSDKSVKTDRNDTSPTGSQSSDFHQDHP